MTLAVGSGREIEHRSGLSDLPPMCPAAPSTELSPSGIRGRRVTVGRRTLSRRPPVCSGSVRRDRTLAFRGGPGAFRITKGRAARQPEPWTRRALPANRRSYGAGRSGFCCPGGRSQPWEASD
jgi:hypothetical protein